MLYFISLILLGLIFLLRKLFSNYYFTPTGFLAITWITFIFLKFLVASDYYFSLHAVVLFVIFIFSFFIGELFMFLYLSKERNSIILQFIDKVNLEADLEIFKQKKVIRTFNLILIVLGSLSFLGSLLYLQYFVRYFGSVSNVLTAGWALRGALEEINIPLIIRAILLLGYSSIILILVHFILYNKFRWFFLLPFISMLIMGITQAGRAGFMMILFQIFIMSFWRQIFKNVTSETGKLSFVKGPEYKMIKSSFRLVLFVAIIFVGGDMLRSQDFSFNSEIIEQGLTSFKAYLFGGIAAFCTYLNEYRFQDLGWGRFSFSSLYELLGIHKNTLGIYVNYLRISSVDPNEDTNIFTAFRQFMDDFGIVGTVLLMMILGALSNVFFRKAVKGDIASIAFMIVLYTFIFHTPLLSITAHTSVLISAILPYVLIKMIKIKY
ncbi:MAG: O-antigen polymerase [Flavobacterium sp.]|uniref:O-antigen polymerase n=1 Tax=Flavobacterium sp. TaxID=239 RepID=UPI00326547F8